MHVETVFRSHRLLDFVAGQPANVAGVSYLVVELLLAVVLNFLLREGQTYQHPFEEYSQEKDREMAHKDT